MTKKYYKGEKYIYLLMATMLCKRANWSPEKEFSDTVVIGKDNGMVGDQNYYRSFRLQKHDDKWLLNETKTNRHFVNFTRTFQVGYNLDDINNETPAISDYVNEYNENCGKKWIH